ncbi:hypothetical protein C7N43_28490 [Sphingobacteriales bacterium UPWRP_1]|nr:hypothetical protein C7N43_28490 [Sphingobacteriales bacterium UPWRP_1]
MQGRKVIGNCTIAKSPENRTYIAVRAVNKLDIKPCKFTFKAKVGGKIFAGIGLCICDERM